MKRFAFISIAFLCFLFPSYVGAESLSIYEESIYDKTQSESKFTEGQEIDFGFIEEGENRLLDEKEYLEKWNEYNPDLPVTNVTIIDDNDTGISSKSIIGSDGRQKVSNINVSPYRQILYIEAIWISDIGGNLVVLRGSGSSVQAANGAGRVLTAGHVIYETEWNSNNNGINGAADGIVAYRGMQDGEYEAASPASSAKIPTEYIDTGSTRYDLAAIDLQNDFSANIGTLNMSSAANMNVTVGGYPADKPSASQYFMRGNATLDSNAPIYRYTIDTYGGQSGSPIVNNSNNNVVGVHATGSSTRNSGVALNSAYIFFIQN